MVDDLTPEHTPIDCALYLALGVRSGTRHATEARTVKAGVGKALCNASMPVEVQYVPKSLGGFGSDTPEPATSTNVTCKRCLAKSIPHGRGSDHA